MTKFSLEFIFLQFPVGGSSYDLPLMKISQYPMALLAHFIQVTCQSYFSHSKQVVILKYCIATHFCAVPRQ